MSQICPFSEQLLPSVCWGLMCNRLLYIMDTSLRSETDMKNHAPIYAYRELNRLMRNYKDTQSIKKREIIRGLIEAEKKKFEETWGQKP